VRGATASGGSGAAAAAGSAPISPTITCPSAASTTTPINWGSRRTEIVAPAEARSIAGAKKGSSRALFAPDLANASERPLAANEDQ
jgi:hypothetical protein